MIATGLTSASGLFSGQSHGHGQKGVYCNILAVKQKTDSAKRAEVMQSNAPRLLSVRDAAGYLGVSFWTMRDFLFRGMVPSVRLPSPRAGDGKTIRRVLIDRQDLDRFIEANKERE